MCGTSASSAPSVTTICTPSASASSMTVSQNVRQRIAGSGPLSRIRSRGARGIARLVELELGPLDLAREPVGEPDARARGLEVDELLGIDQREARGVEARAHERERRGGRLPGVVPALEGADERRGAEAVGTAFPEERLHRIHGSGVPSGPLAMIGSDDGHRRDHGRDPARRRRRRRRLRLLAQGPADRALGAALPGDRAARPHRRDPGARVPRRRPAGRALRARRPRPRARARRALPRRAAGRGARDRARARPPTRRRSCPSPTATWTSSTASSSTWRGEVHDPEYAALLGALLGRRGAAGGLAARAVHARRPPRLPRRAARAHGRGRHAGAGGVPAAPAAELRPADLRRARARPRQDARVHLRRRDRADRRGPAARATSCSASGCSTPRAAAHERGAAARARALRALPTTAPSRRRGGASAPRRRSRCTGSTRSTRASRARWSTACRSLGACPPTSTPPPRSATG